jgi:transcription elongation factor GreA
VVLQDVGTGKNVTYKLTDSAETDPLAGKISISSPIGQAILGATKGQKVAVRAPRGDRHYTVSSIKA